MSKKTLTRTIGEGVLWFSSGNMFLKAVGFTTTFFVLRYLSVYEYGLITLVLSVVPIFGIFLLPGLSDVIIADMGVEKGKNNIGKLKNLFSSYVILQFILALLAWALIFFGSEIIARFYQGQVSSLLKIISFSFLVVPIRSAFGTVFSVYYKFATHSIYLFLEEFFKLILILLAFFVLDMRAEGVILASVLSQIIAIFVIFPIFMNTYKEFSQVRVDNPEPFWKVIKFHRKWSVFNAYFGRSHTKFRLWIIKFLLGTEVVAIYSVAESLIGHSVSPISLGRVLKPVIAQYTHQKEQFLRIVHKAIKYQFISFLIMGVLAFLLFPHIIIWLFPNYVSSMSLFKIMLLALIPIGIMSISPTVFLALKKQKNLFFINIGKIVISLSILPILIAVFGLNGVAYEFVLTALIFGILRYRMLKKLLPDFRLRFYDFIKVDDYDRLILKKVFSAFKRTFKLS